MENNTMAVTGETNVTRPGARTISEITAEAIQRQMDGADAVIGLGNCLIEAKELLPHGEWLAWLSENLNITERSAQHLMTIARKCSNPKALSDLGKTKVLTILTLPPAERELFMNGDYIPDGADKSVGDMTTRELQQVIRERDEARKEAETAKADAQAAVENWKEAEKNLRIASTENKILRKNAEVAKADAQAAEESRSIMAEEVKIQRSMKDAAMRDAQEALDEADALRKEIQELRDRPPEISVQTERDEAAIEEAREAVRAELTERLDEANRRRDAAQAEAQALRERINEMQIALAKANTEAERVKSEIAAEVSEFQSYYHQAETLVNKMRGVILKLTPKDSETAETLGKSLLSLVANKAAS